MQKILIALVRGYRYAVSPLLGNHCRFHPSCSVYTETAIATHGTMRGAWLSVKRLARCHPWCAGGHDPVPPLGSRPAPADNSKDGKGTTPRTEEVGLCREPQPRAAPGTAAEVRHG